MTFHKSVLDLVVVYYYAGPVHASVGGYRAVAGEGGAVHEVPGVYPAPALLKQESEGGVSLTTGTGAYFLGTYSRGSFECKVLINLQTTERG